MKRKFSIGKLISIIGILILCAGLFFSGIDFISTSSVNVNEKVSQALMNI